MGSGDVSYIIEMSSIWLKNHDGLIRVLTDIWYVPKLKKNIISLGAIESKGLVVIIRDEVLNVISDALLIMKGTRRNNLYYYNGSTVIGVVATISSSSKDSKITSLWHRCLGPVVEVVSRSRHDPGKGHSQAVKWVLQYLLKIVIAGLVFERDDTCDQYAISSVDLDCVGDLDKRQLTSGYAFTLSRAPVSWKSTKHIDVRYQFVREIISEGRILL